MIKVCHMTSAHEEEDVRIFHKECVSLAKAGYEVYLVERGATYNKDGVHIIGVGEIPVSRIKRMMGGAKAVYEQARRLDADIYHFHDPELLPYGLKLKRAGKKVIFDSHEHTLEAVAEKTWIPFPIRKLVYTWYAAFQKRACTGLDAVISVTPNIVEYFKTITRRVVQIANYPIVNENATPPQPDGKTLIFAGGISPQWEHHTILQALERLPECRYHLCGRCDGAYLQQLQALPAWKQVDYMGIIPHPAVAQEMKTCMAGMALLRPGRNTDWNNGTIGNTKIFEEMMAGLPVICTDFILWREIADHWNCGICVDPENVGQIADAIRYLYEHPEEAHEMGRNGRRAVEEEFNWAVEEKKLLELYQEILEE